MQIIPVGKLGLVEKIAEDVLSSRLSPDPPCIIRQVPHSETKTHRKPQPAVAVYGFRPFKSTCIL
jgi:hypothetical protein